MYSVIKLSLNVLRRDKKEDDLDEYYSGWSCKYAKRGNTSISMSDAPKQAC